MNSIDRSLNITAEGTSSATDLGNKTTQPPPSGSRYYRCALQINPFDYVKAHKKVSVFTSENDYNNAIVDSCKNNGIEVIAVTDHYRIYNSAGLINAAQNAGIHVFPGFEAVTKEGVHFLCLFNGDQDIDQIDRLIGDCGIHSDDELSPVGKYDCIEFLETARKWGAICIAAHIFSKTGGLLEVLKGKPRINVWKPENLLLACAIPQSIGDAPKKFQQILTNNDHEYKRKRMPAFLNASDVNTPEDLANNNASCFIKMSTVSTEALRQAFLDPESRIRLHSDIKPKPHAELLGLKWEGGFLRDTAVQFNENLNVIVGGRGTGKSTLIESIRYVLDIETQFERSEKNHLGILNKVLKHGTKISLAVQVHHPSKRKYTIERTIPNPLIIRNEEGEELNICSEDLLPNLKVFGQHEISDLADNQEKLAKLLKSYTCLDQSFTAQKSEVKLKLEQSRNRISNAKRNLEILDENLAKLPGLVEMQKRFAEIGLDKMLKNRKLLIKEEKLFDDLNERINSYRDIYQTLAEQLPIDTAFVSKKALEQLPNNGILRDINRILESLSSQLEMSSVQFQKALNEADDAIKGIHTQWNNCKKSIESDYETSLRELQKSDIDGASYIAIHKQIEELQPLQSKRENIVSDLTVFETDRHNFLQEWQDMILTENHEISATAKKISKKLKNKIRVRVKKSSIKPLEDLLREEIGGRLDIAIEKFASQDDFSPQEFAHQCRKGKNALIEYYGIPYGMAQKLSETDNELIMKIEELHLPVMPEIELNTAQALKTPIWKPLDMLSTGQKSTAILLLLLEESDDPLIIDQPEDDLDNRFITDGIVPMIRQQKRQRQFIFSTHNANIPVLGDAELILGLEVVSNNEGKSAKIPHDNMGSIDDGSVLNLITEVLEGGKTAFETRYSKYGF